tara:strand:+ start:471 stop:728 length:258 start_codon:yes stop_codon:yes gene_type:complete
MKPKVPNEEFRVFLQKLIKAYQSFDNAREYLEDLECDYDTKSMINSLQIDECLTLIEKGLGWEILLRPERINIKIDNDAKTNTQK